ncbi:hypothetical protein FIBSPDRAFT_900778 [Athelia psychrophila]|uniref:Uncharacterized protein n=1 Tax=Athelia psychrophila TaxID=1759441 RepID=A0A165XZW1_9AGAM|nr:hypothetical protein FIBSPDRAFT_900778 [Fibularhizoctonia sp. CBS 109695]
MAILTPHYRLWHAAVFAHLHAMPSAVQSEHLEQEFLALGKSLISQIVLFQWVEYGAAFDGLVGHLGSIWAPQGLHLTLVLDIRTWQNFYDGSCDQKSQYRVDKDGAGLKFKVLDSEIRIKRASPAF